MFIFVTIYQKKEKYLKFYGKTKTNNVSPRHKLIKDVLPSLHSKF